jgi:hypothetical protein
MIELSVLLGVSDAKVLLPLLPWTEISRQLHLSSVLTYSNRGLILFVIELMC